MVTSLGGGSSGNRSINGTCRRFSLTSPDRAIVFASLPAFATAKALSLPMNSQFLDAHNSELELNGTPSMLALLLLLGLVMRPIDLILHVG